MKVSVEKWLGHRTIKGLNWFATSILVLLVAGVGLIYILPGFDLATVRSGSMTPAIRAGDVIITGPVGGALNGEIKPGTIVTYKHGKELITHRVLSIDGKALTMKGDAVEDSDPWSVSLPDVKGIYLFKIPFLGYLLSFIRTKFGWFLSIIIPGALLVGWLMRDILKEAFSNGEKASNKRGGETYRQTEGDAKVVVNTLKETSSDVPVKLKQSGGETYRQTKGDSKVIRDILKEALSDVPVNQKQRGGDIYRQTKGDSTVIRDILKEALSDVQVKWEQRGDVAYLQTKEATKVVRARELSADKK